MTYIQTWYSDISLEDAMNRALADNPKATFLQAEVQTHLFSVQEDVLVIMEVPYAPRKRKV
jgi:hypothetical protein